MANFNIVAAATTLVVGVEYSIALGANYIAGTGRTTTGPVTFAADLTALVSPDVVEVRVYLGPNGTSPVQAGPVATYKFATMLMPEDLGILGNAWNVTLKQTAGSVGLPITYYCIQNTNDVTAAVVGTGAIVETSFAANAIDGAALKADAITKIQSGLALAATALTNVTWLDARAVLLDNLSRLDVATSTLATTTLATTIGTAVVALAAAVADISGRLPPALDAGNLLASVQTVASPALSAIGAAVWQFAHSPGRTAKGALFRLDQLVTGRHSGLLAALWTLFDVDGVTPLVVATQDPAGGTRAQASVVAGD